MKHISLMILFAAITLSGMAQTIGEAFYIYRNDGQFNAFFRDEVQSIEYSYYDADSVKYEEIVTQVVITADSVYKIPLAAIDSVGFVQPEVIIKDNVVMMEKEMMDNLVSVEGMNLCFTKNMAEKYNLKKGDIIAYTNYDDERFEEGFIGKVSNVNVSADSYQISCDSVKDISDIFDQLIMVELLSKSDDGNLSRRGSKEDDYERWRSNSIPLSWDLNVHTKNEVLNASLSGGVQGNVLVKVAYNFTQEDHFIALTIEHDWSYNAKFNVSAKGPFNSVNTMSIRPLSPVIRFPAMLPIFRFQIGGTSFVRGEGGIDFDLSLSSPVHKYTTSITFDDWVFTGSHTNNTLISDALIPTVDASLSLDGFIQGGLMTQFDLGTIRCLGWVNASVDCYIGPKLEGNFTLKISSQQEGEIDTYNLLKDSKLSLSPLTLDVEAYGQVHWLDNEKLRHKFFSGSFPSLLYREWYLLPEFSKVECQRTKSGYQFITNPSRDILFPVQLGFGIYNQNDTKITDYYKDEIYRLNNNWSTNNLTFLLSDNDGIRPGQEYTCYPMVNLWGIDIRAIPPVKFGTSLDIQTGYVKNIKEACVDAYGHIISEDLNWVSKYEYGIRYKEKDASGDWVCMPSQMNNDGSFYVVLNKLNPNTEYNYCAYIRFAEDDYLYGDVLSFKTKGQIKIVTGEVTNINTNSATLNGYYESSDPSSECGFIYSASSNLSYNNGSIAKATSYTNGNFSVTLSDLEENTTYYYCAYYYSDGEYQYGETCSFKTNKSGGTGVTSCPNGNHPHWIDLGLPSGTQWRCCNEGASTPEAYGGYYAFGQVSSAPTIDQIQELLGYCSSEWTTLNGVNGRKFTGPNGGTIFLPAAGYRWGGEFYYVGSYGDYWSSTTNGENGAYGLDFDSYSANWLYDDRHYEPSVRPVR